jgi:hypothetical protein
MRRTWTYIGFGIALAAYLCMPAGCRKPPPEGEASNSAAVARESTAPGDAATAQPAKPQPRKAAESPPGATPVQSPDQVAPQVDPTDGAIIETRRTTHKNGALRREWHVKRMSDGSTVEHGRWSAWHNNGELYLDGEYVNGVRHGPWPSWHVNGQLRGSGQFEYGNKVGTWIYWDDTGRKRHEWSYLDDKKHGRATDWDEHGKVTASGEYVNGLKHGPWIEVDAQGQETETHWVNGEPQE